MQMFAWIKLRWRQAFSARYGKCLGVCALRLDDALQRLDSPGRQGSPENLTKRNSLAFSVYLSEGSALGKQVRLLICYASMHFCFASLPLRFNLNSTTSGRLKKT
jgi:hypothetical protein